MKTLIFALLCALTASLHAIETKMLLAEMPGVPSASISVAQGERIELVCAAFDEVNVNSSDQIILHLVGPDWIRSIPLFENETKKIARKIVLVGPLTASVEAQAPAGRKGIVTFDIQRIGESSNPASIPQEVGSNFNVILEQSSDLVNWTPANPGTYTGTEVKRFFRTRIVKLP